MQYDIFYNGRIVGEASVIEEGLYNHIHGVCGLPGKLLYRLYVECNNVKINLGTCIPDKGFYALDKRISRVTFTSDALKFYIIEGENEKSDTVIVDINSPVSYISKLPNSFLCIGDKEFIVAFHKDVNYQSLS